MPAGGLVRQQHGRGAHAAVSLRPLGAARRRGSTAETSVREHTAPAMAPIRPLLERQSARCAAVFGMDRCVYETLEHRVHDPARRFRGSSRRRPRRLKRRRLTPGFLPLQGLATRTKGPDDERRCPRAERPGDHSGDRAGVGEGTRGSMPRSQLGAFRHRQQRGTSSTRCLGCGTSHPAFGLRPSRMAPKVLLPCFPWFKQGRGCP